MTRRPDNLRLVTSDTPLPAVDPALADAVRRFRRAKAELARARLQTEDPYRGWDDLYAGEVRRGRGRQW